MRDGMDRRSFLRGAGALAAGALAGGKAEQAHAQEKPANVERGVLEQGVLPMERFEEEALASLAGLLNDDDTREMSARVDSFGSRILVNYGPLAVYSMAGDSQTKLLRKMGQAGPRLSPERGQEIGKQVHTILSSKDEVNSAYIQFHQVAFQYLRVVQYKRNQLNESTKSGYAVHPKILDMLNEKMDLNLKKAHAAAIELAKKNNELLRILAALPRGGQ